MRVDKDALRKHLESIIGPAMGVDFLMGVSLVEELRNASEQRLKEIAEE